MERRIVAQLITSLDDLPKLDKGEQVLVIGATNRTDTLDPALRRVGRFDQEISLGIPDRDARNKIVRIICKNLRLESFFDYDLIASLTPGFVGADLLSLATRAGLLAVKRILHGKQENALKNVANSVDKIPPNVDINISDALLMQIDSVLTQTKNDDSDSLNLPSNIGTTETSNDEKQTAKTDVPDIDDGTNKENQIDTSKTDTEQNEAKLVNDEHKGNASDEPKHLQNDINNDDSVQKEASSENSEMIVDASTDSTNIETLGEAMLRNNAIKDRMGLDVMFKWLSHADGLVSDEDLNELYITIDDFKEAIKLVQPSAKREGFITVPDVTWDDIGSLRDIREELKMAIMAPVKFPKQLKALGINAPSGILLCGPPGKLIRL